MNYLVAVLYWQQQASKKLVEGYNQLTTPHNLSFYVWWFLCGFIKQEYKIVSASDRARLFQIASRLYAKLPIFGIFLFNRVPE